MTCDQSLVAEIQQGLGDGDAGIIHHHGYHTEGRLSFSKGRIDTRAVGDIHGHSKRLATGCDNVITGRLYALGAPRRQYHLGARLGQYSAKVPAKTAGCPGHQGHFTLQT